MAAPIGNEHNKKWRLENAQELVNDVLEYVKNRNDCFSIAYACSDLGYYETILYHLKDHVKGLDFEPIKVAKEIIKARLINLGVKGDTNATMSIFVLKNNHGMKDKTEHDHTTKGESINHISLGKGIKPPEDNGVTD